MDDFTGIIAGINDMIAKSELWCERVQEAALRRSNEFLDKLWEEFGEYQRAKITSLFRSAVGRFYDAYEPQKYVRTHSLYNLLQLPTDDRGLVEYGDTMDLIDRSKIHRDRQGGDSLFDTVFMEGWHGGAKYISPDKEDAWGKHPEPGIPYWRKKGRGHRYGSWGRRAVRTALSSNATAPYWVFDEELDDSSAELGNAFIAIDEKLWGETCDEINLEVSMISKEIYG